MQTVRLLVRIGSFLVQFAIIVFLFLMLAAILGVFIPND